MSKKGENIYKRKDNRWEARFIKGYENSGKAKYGYRYGKTYKEAKAKMALAITETFSNSELIKHTSKTRYFRNYCNEWLTINKYKIKESTYIKYLNIIEKHINPKLGNYCLKDLDSLIIEKFSQYLIEQEKLSSKTTKDILTVLKSILKYADGQEPDCLKKIEVIYPRERKKEMRILSQDEQKKFVDFLLEDMDEFKFGILLSLMTGMRIGEICALRWENISFEDKTIRIVSTLQRLKNLDINDSNKTKIVISNPKSDMSMRIIPMTENIELLCRRFCQRNKEAFVLSSTVKYVEPRTLQYKLKKYTEECGLENVHFHVLRHTFATRCVEVGFEIKSLSEILGHSSPKITLERYVHSSLEMKRSNMNKLTNIKLNI